MLNKSRFLITLLLFVWELPQTATGVLLFFILKYKKQVTGIEKESHLRFIETKKLGVSLGWFIFWSPSGNRFAQYTNDCRMHEYGHARQSVMLGPLYLLIVGIPSVSRVFYSRWYYKKHGLRWKNYFAGYPENWADKLGGVIDEK